MTNRAALSKLAEGAELPDGLTPERIEGEEFERVKFTMYMAVVAEAIPRRLGRDAEGAALALDKKIARRVANAYRSLWMTYSATLDAPPAPRWESRGDRLKLARDASPGARKVGAVVSWGRWLSETRAEVEGRRKAVARVAVENGLPKWGVKRVNVLGTELQNLERIMREVVSIRDRRSPSGARNARAGDARRDAEPSSSRAVP